MTESKSSKPFDQFADGADQISAAIAAGMEVDLAASNEAEDSVWIASVDERARLAKIGALNEEDILAELSELVGIDLYAGIRDTLSPIITHARAKTLAMNAEVAKRKEILKAAAQKRAEEAAAKAKAEAQRKELEKNQRIANIEVDILSGLSKAQVAELLGIKESDIDAGGGILLTVAEAKRSAQIALNTPHQVVQPQVITEEVKPVDTATSTGDESIGVVNPSENQPKADGLDVNTEVPDLGWSSLDLALESKAPLVEPLDDELDASLAEEATEMIAAKFAELSRNVVQDADSLDWEVNSLPAATSEDTPEPTDAQLPSAELPTTPNIDENEVVLGFSWETLSLPADGSVDIIDAAETPKVQAAEPLAVTEAIAEPSPIDELFAELEREIEAKGVLDLMGPVGVPTEYCNDFFQRLEAAAIAEAKGFNTRSIEIRNEARSRYASITTGIPVEPSIEPVDAVEFKVAPTPIDELFAELELAINNSSATELLGTNENPSHYLGFISQNLYDAARKMAGADDTTYDALINEVNRRYEEIISRHSSGLVTIGGEQSLTVDTTAVDPKPKQDTLQDLFDSLELPSAQEVQLPATSTRQTAPFGQALKPLAIPSQEITQEVDITRFTEEYRYIAGEIQSQVERVGGGDNVKGAVIEKIYASELAKFKRANRNNPDANFEDTPVYRAIANHISQYLVDKDGSIDPSDKAEVARLTGDYMRIMDNRVSSKQKTAGGFIRRRGN